MTMTMKSTEVNRDMIKNLFAFVSFVVVVLAGIAADSTSLMSIVSFVVALAHFVGVCVCVVYVVAFTLLIVSHLLPCPMLVQCWKCTEVGFQKARRWWVAANFSSRCQPRRVRFIEGIVTDVVLIESHRSYTPEERMRTFSGKETIGAMALRNNIEHAWERSLGRVVEEDEFFIDGYGRQIHPAHAHWILKSSTGQAERLIAGDSHRPRRVRFVEGFVTGVVVIESHSSLTREERLRARSENDVVRCNKIEHAWERRFGRVVEEDEFYVDSCGKRWHPAHAQHWMLQSLPRQDHLVTPSVEEVADVAVVVNTEDIDYSNDDEDDSDSDSSCSTSIIHHDEPLENVELIEDCSSGDEDSSSVGSFGFSAGSGDGDVPVQTELQCTTEAPSSTVPCAQPSQRCRTRPFLARRAKVGPKRYT